MKKFVCLFLLCISAWGRGASKPPEYNRYFSDNNLRIDISLSNKISADGKESDRASFVHFYLQRNYAGQKEVLIDPREGGDYKITVVSLSKKMLFAKGFNTLYHEWMHMKEREKKERSFEQSISIPYPKEKVYISIQKRTGFNAFVTLRDTLFVPLKRKERIRQAASDSSVPFSLLWGEAPTPAAIDLTIVSEGYTKSEMGKFVVDAREMMTSLFAKEPYSRYKEKFAIRLVEAPAEESGISIPNKNIFRKTLFNTSFNTLGMERYLGALSCWKINDFIRNVPSDHIIVLANSDEYGGSGLYNEFSIITARNPLSAATLAHELGHGLIGLADEYEANTTYDNLYALSTEPWEENITTLNHFESKWKNKISDATPIPTPFAEAYRHTIGVYEGAAYASKGIYRPYISCAMRALSSPFCPICLDVFERKITLMTKDK